MKEFFEKFKNFYKNVSKKKFYVTLAGLLALFVILWAFISAIVITKNFNREQLLGTENRQELDVKSVILVESRDDKKYWEIYAKSGSYESDNKIAFLNNVTGNFYKDNEVTMSFESLKGSYNEVKQEIILYDDIHIVIKDGTSLFCDTLVWQGSDKDIKVDGNVKIVKDNQLLSTGEKGVISSDYSRFKLSGKTVTKLYETKEKKK